MQQQVKTRSHHVIRYVKEKEFYNLTFAFERNDKLTRSNWEFQLFLQHLQVRPIEPCGVLERYEIPSIRLLKISQHYVTRSTCTLDPFAMHPDSQLYQFFSHFRHNNFSVTTSSFKCLDSFGRGKWGHLGTSNCCSSSIYSKYKVPHFTPPCILQ